MKSTRATPAVLLTTWGLLGLLAGHDLSHALDNGLDTSLSGLALVATPQWLVLAAVMAVILRADRPRAHAAALILGLGVSGGLLAVHLLPLSAAPYSDLDPSAVSWLLAWLPAAVGFMLAALAWPRKRPAGA